MPQPQIDHIVQLGFTTVALLAHGLHEESQMESLLSFSASFLKARSIRLFLLSLQPFDEFSKRVFPDVFSKAEMWHLNPLLHLQPSPSYPWSKSNP